MKIVAFKVLLKRRNQVEGISIGNYVFAGHLTPARGNGLGFCFHEGSRVHFDLRPILEVITSPEMKASTEF